jgi:hypothetical protein
LQVFERAPLRLGAQVALSAEAFGAAVSLGGAGSVAVGAWLMVEHEFDALLAAVHTPVGTHAPRYRSAAAGTGPAATRPTTAGSSSIWAETRSASSTLPPTGSA